MLMLPSDKAKYCPSVLLPWQKRMIGMGDEGMCIHNLNPVIAGEVLLISTCSSAIVLNTYLVLVHIRQIVMVLVYRLISGSDVTVSQVWGVVGGVGI